MSDSEKRLEFKIGDNPSDNSLINIDSGKMSKQIEITSRRLDNFLPSVGIESVDFLKIDAEGAEIEVLKGTRDIPIDKISVDVSNERHGESTLEEVRNWLLEQGYELEIHAEESPKMVYARYAE